MRHVAPLRDARDRKKTAHKAGGDTTGARRTVLKRRYSGRPGSRHQTAPETVRDGLSAIPHAELAEQSAGMGFHGVLR
jgi:hypothetical protein